MTDRYEQRMYLNDVLARSEERTAARLAAAVAPTEQHPIDLLAAAAQRLRDHPATPYDTALAELLDVEADVARTMVKQAPEMTTKDIAGWVCGPLQVARAVLGQDGGWQ